MPEMKEPFFFCGEIYYPKVKVISNFEDYISIFEHAGENQVLGEATPIYLWLYRKTIENIRKHIPNWRELKIIIILRNPVERAFSDYSIHKQIGDEPLKFETAISPGILDERRKNDLWRWAICYVEAGFYYEQVKAYLDIFPQVKVYLFEALKADPRGLVKDMFRFLHVDDSFIPDMGEIHNPAGILKSKLFYRILTTPDFVSSIFPPLKLIPLDIRVKITNNLKRLNIRDKSGAKEKTRQYLRNLYREDILKLQELIKKDLSAWLE